MKSKGRISVRWAVALVGVVIGGATLLILVNDTLRAYLGHDPYAYRYFCYPGTDRCITVVTYRRFKFVDPTFKRYVFFGKQEYRMPFGANYVEYPNDTNLFVEWKTDTRLEITSNLRA